LQIVLRECGGLGNQLFQYAALRYYARRYGAEMRISVDPEWNALSYGYPRPCLYAHYSITVPMQKRSLWDRMLLTGKPWLKASVAPLKGALKVQVFTQPPEHRYIFSPELPLDRAINTLHIVGWWHSYVIVEEVARELRTELVLKEPARGRNLEVLKQIRTSRHPVSIHVRRGDSTIAATGRVALPFEYYSNAISTFEERFADPDYFVFSDDMQFVKDHLPRGIRAVFVDHNDDFTAHEDLRLMSSCHHHIIANSTFSWWGAWLNPRPGKMVIAPKQWYLTEDSFYSDLLPKSWMLADVVARSSWAGTSGFIQKAGTK
jgi:hypothetical protein